MMLPLLHETGFAHAHPHLDPIVVAAFIGGIVFAGWVVRRILKG
ncbi:MAG TPA: hypothetical protein VKZ59_10615 [Acidobacteriota bacterium]|nr:hypothetical protein [Acidobacteriota bacterium]